MRFTWGPEITLHAFDHKHYADFGFTLYGTEGRLETVNNGMGLKYYAARESTVFSGYNELYPASLPVRGVKETDRLIPYGIEMLRDHLEGKTILDVSGRDALATLRVLEAIKESATKGGVLWLGPDQNDHGQATPS
jgi:predicted dehydrogenase